MKSIITKYKPSFMSTLKCSVPLTTRRPIQIPSNPTFRVIHSSEMAFFTRRLVLVSRSLPLQIRWILVRKCSNQPAMPVLTSPFQADPIKLKVSLLFNVKLSNFYQIQDSPLSVPSHLSFLSNDSTSVETCLSLVHYPPVLSYSFPPFLEAAVRRVFLTRSLWHSSLPNISGKVAADKGKVSFKIFPHFQCSLIFSVISFHIMAFQVSKYWSGCRQRTSIVQGRPKYSLDKVFSQQRQRKSIIQGRPKYSLVKDKGQISFRGNQSIPSTKYSLNHGQSMIQRRPKYSLDQTELFRGLLQTLVVISS